MLVVYADEVFATHATPQDHPECPERSRAALRGLQGLGCVAAWRPAVPGALEDVVRVHDPGYAAALEQLARRGGGALDPDTWVSPRSYDVALSAVGTLMAATDAALQPGAGPEERRSFAAVRPPGHHARPATAMGFCLFNNVAVAARRATAVHGLERVAIVDFDVHHGNGTQEIFWADPSALYVSLHRDRFYPGTGAADETGTGKGLGTTLNLPLPGSTRPAAYREAFSRAMDAVRAYRPQLLLASAGFDAWRHDPVGGLGLAVEDYAWIGAELARVADDCCQGRLVSVLEGGYDLEALGSLVRAYAEGVAGA